MAKREFGSVGARYAAEAAYQQGTFDGWMKAVDAEVVRRTGLGVDDLPDCCYRDWYEDDMTPASAAKRAIRNAREE